MVSSSSGNVLFLILIAVALFAALSYAVTSSTRSGGGDASSEQLAMSASRLTQYGTQIENALVRMRMTNGCSEQQISFEPPPFDGTTIYYNGAAPASKICHVFHPSGGNVPFMKPPADWLDPAQSAAGHYGTFVYTGHICIIKVATGDSNLTCTAASNSELLLFVPMITKDLCLAINKKLGIASVAGDAPQDGSGTYGTNNNNVWIGFYQQGWQIGDPGKILEGQMSGCVKLGNAHPPNTYGYYHVLIPH